MERELMVEKLKRGVLVGKREGNSTPSPTWKFGSVQRDGTLIPDSNLSPSLLALSARKLGANLWEMEPQFSQRVERRSKNGPIFAQSRSGGKDFGISKEFDEAQAVASSSKQEPHGVNLKRRQNARVENVGQAQRPLSPGYSSSKEMANSKFGESSRGLKTSTELLKVLNRIWSLEEKHALDMSLVKTLRQELDQSKARIQELMQEKKRDKSEVGSLMKQLREYKVARKKDQEQIKNAVKSVEKLEDERKLRRHSEKRHQKELSEIKSSFSNALRELDQERKARVRLEDLCDAFAKGVRDYERELRAVKHETCTDQIDTEGNDRLILHISEAWLDERTQMKLADAHDASENRSVLDKLCLEIECFLREKQSGDPGKMQDVSSSKTPGESNFLARSLESFHLNEPASAPWNVNDEDDSVGIVRRDRRLKQGNETTDTSNPRMPRKSETMQRSFHERVTTNADADVDETKLKHGYNCMESCLDLDPTAVAGPPSPVKKWTLEAPATGPGTPESCSKRPKTTLKAKLMEARQERLQRSRKSLWQGEGDRSC